VPAERKTSSAASAPDNSSEIDAFLSLIAIGLKHLVTAGQMLGKMLQSDPQVFGKILARCHWLTEDALWTLKNIGDRKFRPELFFTKPHVSSRLIGFDYQTQSEIIDGGVPIVISVPDKEKPVVSVVRVMELSPSQVRIAFSGNGLRPISEQAQLVAPVRSKTGTISDFKSGNQRINASEFSGLKPTNHLPAVGKKVEPLTQGVSHGFFRLVMKFGQPALVRIPKDAATRNPRLQRLTMHAGMLDEMEATFELVKPTTPVA